MKRLAAATLAAFLLASSVPGARATIGIPHPIGLPTPTPTIGIPHLPTPFIHKPGVR
jgi:hypothetical protein